MNEEKNISQIPAKVIPTFYKYDCKNGLNEKTDFQLVMEKDEAGFIKKYNPLILKLTNKWYKVRKNDASVEFSDVYMDCLEFSITAFRKIKKNKIDENFKAGMYLSYRINSYAKAKAYSKKSVMYYNTSFNEGVNNLKKEAHIKAKLYYLSGRTTEEAIFDVEDKVENIEKNYNKSEVNNLYMNFKMSLSKIEKKILNGLEKQKTLKSIAEDLGCGSNNIVYYRDKIKKKYVSFMNENGFSMSHSYFN